MCPSYSFLKAIACSYWYSFVAKKKGWLGRRLFCEKVFGVEVGLDIQLVFFPGSTDFFQAQCCQKVHNHSNTSHPCGASRHAFHAGYTLGCIRRNSLHQKYQLVPAHWPEPDTLTQENPRMETSLLQPLVIHRKAFTLPMQQLHYLSARAHLGSLGRAD